MAHPLDLFPVPSPPVSRNAPRVWPGVTPKSTDVLRTTLGDNYKRWHVFFDPKGFHNHASHFLLALWSLGADPAILTAAYAQESAYQRPAFDSPEPITLDNFGAHLGDDNYFSAYREFFTEVVRTKGATAAIEEYVFDKKHNFDSAGGGHQMLDRFLDALLHPIIHVGYGLEFGLPGMIVEGLASTAVHAPTSAAIITPALFESGIVESLTDRLPAALNITSGGRKQNVHAFTILARILKDSYFDGRKGGDMFKMYSGVMETHGEALKKHVAAWTIDLSDPTELDRKIEELVWVNAIIYGVGGWSKGTDFNADFFHMHLVTSSLFLSTLAAVLAPPSQERLLRAYFAVCLAWWVGRGRPGFDIPGFFADDTAHPAPLGPFPTPSAQTLPSQLSPQALTPNAWLPLLQTTLVHTDDHLPKLQRSLAHYGALYGTRPAGEPDFAGTELPGAEKLDGTLFIRIAGLSAKRMGRVREGEEPGTRFWDRQGFYSK